MSPPASPPARSTGRSSATTTATSSATPRARTMLVTLLGSVVRRMGGWMPIAGTVELLGQAGIDAPSARTAVHRLKQRGWLESQPLDGTRGYALTPEALRVLAAGDEVIWHARTPADLADGWCVVTFSIPESDRTRRQQLRSHLSHLGFGNIGTATWLAPARMRKAAEQAITELGLEAYAAVFVGAYTGTQDLTAMLYDSFDLQAVDRGYREFLTEFAPQADAVDGPTPSEAVSAQEAFVAYVTLVDRWRRLPFRDPGLPLEVLGPQWSAPDAVELFERLVGLLEPRALAHAARSW